jgi:hypothetical protein
MSASVMPSLRYSVSDDPLAFTNGKTATDSMRPVLPLIHQYARAGTARPATTTAAMTALRPSGRGGAAAGSATLVAA